jgi:hypothetical protein
MKSISNYTSIFLIGYLFNSILMRLTGRISMEDIMFPIIIITLISLSLLCSNYELVKKKIKSIMLKEITF